LDEISVFVFRAFDTDQNGSISFNEFMIAYALTARGYKIIKLTLKLYINFETIYLYKKRFKNKT